MMKRYSVKVIDGSVPVGAWKDPEIEPYLESAQEAEAVLEELKKREPLFHRPELGIAREDFEKMTAPCFWEVGASGRRYSRKFVIDTLEARYKEAFEDTWEIEDFRCLEIAADNYLATYTLIQGERVTRRATIWRRTFEGWQILYHQGTIVTCD
jgi:hypothetical protein